MNARFMIFYKFNILIPQNIWEIKQNEDAYQGD